MPEAEKVVGETVSVYDPVPAYRVKGICGYGSKKEKPPMAKVQVAGRDVVLDRERVALARVSAGKAWRHFRLRHKARVARQARKMTRRKSHKARVDTRLIRGRKAWQR